MILLTLTFLRRVVLFSYILVIPFEVCGSIVLCVYWTSALYVRSFSWQLMSYNNLIASI